MGKKAVLKFFIYLCYAISGIITLLLLILPAWDNQSEGEKVETVGVFLQEKDGHLDFGYMPNEKANESSLYKIAVYTVIYLCLLLLVNLLLIGLSSLDSNKVAKWLHVILCCAHCTGLVFVFLIYSIRYLIVFKPPLRNYYLDIFAILIDFILILLLIMYKRKKNIDYSMNEIQVEGGAEGGEEISKINSKKSTIKKNNTKNPQLISEGLATPLYVDGAEVVEHQPTVNKPVVDHTKIVVSDNIVNNETYMDHNGNQFQYNPAQQMEINTTYAPPAPNNIMQSPVVNPVGSPMVNPVGSPVGSPVCGPMVNPVCGPAVIPVGGPAANPVGNPVNNNNGTASRPHKLNSQYTFSESNPYPVAHDTVYNKIPEIPIIGKKDEETK